MEGGGNYGNNFTQTYKTKLTITCASYAEWNKTQVLMISRENLWSYYLLLD